MKNILIIGATSAIAEATAKLFAKEGDKLYLVARNEERLSKLSEDLKIRGANSVKHSQLDVNNFDLHEHIINKAIDALEIIDVVLITHGTLPNQNACEKTFHTTLSELNTNAISTISLLTIIANKLEQQKFGTIAVITSVAGDRGRQSNYVYGTAKGMLSIFLQGLRNRLYKYGVHVLDIKPGFVETPMTLEFNKGLIWTTPNKIAKGICHAITQKKNEIYLPWFWRYIMAIIKFIPEAIFKRLEL